MEKEIEQEREQETGSDVNEDVDLSDLPPELHMETYDDEDIEMDGELDDIDEDKYEVG